jgi:NDP-sugar pyrophosphorylase family protein
MHRVKALVLCGGLGTRLGSLTRDLPKPLLPIEGRPLLGYTLALLARQGFDDVALNLHFHGERIAEEIGDGSRFGVRVTYSRESELLGTAGTVRSLEPFFADVDDALVLYGDLLLDVDLGVLLTTHRERRADATLMLHRRARSNSVVTMDDEGRITSFVERPIDPDTSSAWVNSGVAVLARSARAKIPERVPADLPRDLYVPQVHGLRLFGCPLDGYRCAIDSAARYEEACRAARDGRVRRA